MKPLAKSKKKKPMWNTKLLLLAFSQEVGQYTKKHEKKADCCMLSWQLMERVK